MRAYSHGDGGTDEWVSQDETSEQIIGEWMEQRGVRDQMVIATKVCGFKSVKF